MDSRRLLAALKEIRDAADGQGIDFWLLGGLAHAFHAGRLYRDYNDLDLIVRTAEDYSRFCLLIERLGYKRIRDKQLPCPSTLYNRDGIEVDCGYHMGAFGLLLDDFEDADKELEGVRCKVLSRRFCISYKRYLIES